MSNAEQFNPEDRQVVRQVAKEVEHAARMARWFGLGLLAVGVLAMVASAVATVYIGVNVRGLVRQDVAEQAQVARDLEARNDLVGDILRCILGQFAEHRQTSRSFFDQSARHHGHPLLPAGEPQPADTEATRTACDRALRALED